MLRKTVLARALQVAFAAGVATIAVAPNVMAQSNASGNIYGSVESPSGATIVVINKETGLRRTVTPEANGRYQLAALPVGQYTVQLTRNGNVENTTEVDVRVGQGTDASFSSKIVQAVQVTGRRSRIDMSNTNSGATFTAKELAKLPVTPSVASIIQLAPNTTRGDSRYGDGGAPSFGGSAASENAFYINGFPVTNVLFQVGSSELPFGAIGQAQVLTGGFGAEFGRSTGGVVNIQTKSGTNNWEVGGSVSWEPNSLRASQRNLYYPNTGAPENKETDGKIYRWDQDDTRTKKIGSVYVGGPIIKDKLFMYANVERTKLAIDETRQYSDNPAAINTGWQERRDTTNRALVKLDWNISDNHRLEGTYILDDPKSDRTYYGFNYDTTKTVNGIAPLTHGNVAKGGAYYESYGPTPVAAPVGAEIKILNYTGNLSDNVTLTAMIGNSMTEHVYLPVGYNPDLMQISAVNSARIPGFNYINPQTTTGNILTPGAFDEQKVMALNLQWVAGNHTIRVGADKNNIKSKAGTSRAGGGTWQYGFGDPNVPLGPNVAAPASNGGYGAQGYYVQRIRVSGVSTPSVEQSAQYIEDSWQVHKDVVVKLGLRNEQFTNYNGDGQPYVSQRHQLAPRLGATWDVNGDNSMKVFGNLGRYHLQMPTNVAVRAAGASLFTREYFTYTGVDQTTGAPTGLTPLSGVTSTNNEFGQSKDPRTVAAQGMDSLYQDELIVGFERQYSPSLNFGAKVTYRKLQSSIDDFCDSRPFQKWGIANGIEGAADYASNCFLFNPGEDNDFLVDYGTGKLTPVHLTASELGYPKVKRTYAALDLFVEHPLRNGWYGKINYTFSRNAGNTEGQTRSDSGQADVSTTAVWDMPELSLYANGLLPNDRKHQLKAFGYYQFNDQFTAGANLLLASGRPKNCIGNLPQSYYDAHNDATGYNSEFFFCDEKPAPRGSRGRQPWDIRLDLNVAYSPTFLKGLVLKADVYNVFNRQVAQNMTEDYNTDAATTVNALYGGVLSYTTPRTVRLSAEYNYKF